MKKVFALGVASLLMLGAASQASASFEKGNIILSIYDTTKSVEYGFDLGNWDANTQDKDLGTINLGSAFTSAAYFGIFSNETVGTTYKSFFGLMNETSADFGGKARSSSTELTFMNNVSENYASYAQGSNVAVIDSSFFSTDENTYYNAIDKGSAGAGLYAYILTGDAKEGSLADVVDGSVLNMYLYQHERLTAGSTGYGLANNGAPLGVIELTFHQTAGVLTADVALNPSAVPVPGAALLLGSSLLGLAGLRRRKNS